MLRFFSAVVSFVVACVAACSSAEPPRPHVYGTDYGPGEGGGRSDAGASAATDAESASCTAFEKRACTIDLGVVNGVHNCVAGFQICEGDTWSACVED